MIEELPADDILSAIFVLAKRLSNKDRLAFRSHDYNLQQIFYDLVKDHPFPILSSYVFSTTGPLPYSSALTESISKLQFAGIIGRENPDYEVLFLRPSGEEYFEQVVKKRLGKGHMSQLEQTAGNFLRKIKVIS